ncbi:MAG TPA: hypothetical protein VGC97_02680 [Pyrinomonadaceae bacterium]|jgi:hypothetical protein
MNKDLEHLKWLSTGFYVYAGLTALFACFPFIHLAIGIAIVTGQLDEGKNPPPAAFGWLFVGAASIFIVIGWAIAICSFLAGKYIKQQKNYTFIFVMGAVACMFAPLGTVLGVFTIIVLLRDSVKALFEGQNNQFGSTPPDWK